MSLTAARLSADSSQRIRTALTEAVLQDRSLRKSESDAIACTPPTPWDLLLDDSITWRTKARLNRQLFCELRGHFGSNVIREILLAAAGVKISRTCLTDSKLELLRNIADRHGFALSASSERYVHRRDAGKGGSSNSIERVAGPDEDGGLRNVYVAAEPALAETGAMLEEAGDDENFGLLLGIPSCCREAYMRLSPIAAAAQNDLVLLALENTAGPMPYNFWLNYAANYFGPALISFFPCSFLCANAAAVARSTFEMLHACDAIWAGSFWDTHKTNILYTEYQGLHLFRRPLVGCSIEYGCEDHKSTEPDNTLSELVSRGSRLEVCGKHAVLIYRDAAQIGSVEGADVGMCAFH